MIYIHSTGLISPQGALHSPGRMRAVEPDYTGVLDPKLLRRMSRIIRMGVAAGLECLGGVRPDAIITGTAYGCLEDTTIFLRRMVENKEEMLTPTAFIQSTHNTVGAQIALMLGCHGYNNTFVHRGFSFESALLDGMMLIEEGAAGTVLVGGIDEITDTSHAILSRFGLYKGHVVNGEGASFFLLSGERGGVCLEAMETLYRPEDPLTGIRSFLEKHPGKVDLFVLGKNGEDDGRYDAIGREVLPGVPVETFKQLSGEYPTASAFGLAVAARRPGRVLLYNAYQNTHHSLSLVSPC
jgi:3-oxoacyl-[acyl-carrier-protein] synthase II